MSYTDGTMTAKNGSLSNSATGPKKSGQEETLLAHAKMRGSGPDEERAEASRAAPEGASAARAENATRGDGANGSSWRELLPSRNNNKSPEGNQKKSTEV